MNKQIQNKVTVQLAGGLGNQLFGYSAGTYLSKKLGLPLLLDFSQIDRGTTKHGSDIREFQFEIPEVIDVREDFSSFEYRSLRAQLVLSRFGLPYPMKANFDLFSSKVVGRDPSFERVSRPCFVRGYFQSWEYPDATDASMVLAPREPSRWFEAMNQEAAETTPVAIHVRRGDYSKAASDYGLLGRGYYDLALTLAREKNPNRPIWGFSDDVPLAQSLLRNHKNIRWINPPNGIRASESLALMSNSSGNIVANSTFSWWAAYASPHGAKDVYVPNKWYRGMPDPIDLIPQSWIRVPSDWSD